MPQPIDQALLIVKRILIGALDFSQVQISTSSPDLDLGEPGVSKFSYYDVTSGAGEPVRREFTSGTPALGDAFAGDFGISLTDSFTVAGGELKVGGVMETDPETSASGMLHVGVWTKTPSSEWCLCAHVYNGATADVVDLFSRFAITEGAVGISMRANVGSGASIVRDYLHAPAIAKPASALGLIEVFELTPQLASLVPSSGGTVVGDSIYWVEEPGSTEGAMTVLLVTPTAYARVYPHPGISEADVVSRAASLSIKWYPPAVPEV